MSDESNDANAESDRQKADAPENHQSDQEGLERFDESVSGMRKMKKGKDPEGDQSEDLPGEGGGIGSSVSGARGLKKKRGKKGDEGASSESSSKEEGGGDDES